MRKNGTIEWRVYTDEELAQKREHVLTLRVNDAERGLLHASAALAGCDSISEFLRDGGFLYGSHALEVRQQEAEALAAAGG